MMTVVGRQRGFQPPSRAAYDQDTSWHGALYVGAPEQIAERIVELYGHLRHVRHLFQMDIGGLYHRDFLRSIELLGTQVNCSWTPNSRRDRGRCTRALKGSTVAARGMMANRFPHER